MQTSTDLYIYKTQSNNLLIRKVKSMVAHLQSKNRLDTQYFSDKNITENEEIYWVDFPVEFQYDYEQLMNSIGWDFNVNRVYVDHSWQIDVISRKNVGSVVRIKWEADGSYLQ
tara:strand:+ start:1180 stop:1518 length:339 start_codon:yes stop_codon:yes gene_type:complete